MLDRYGGSYVNMISLRIEAHLSVDPQRNANSSSMAGSRKLEFSSETQQLRLSGPTIPLRVKYLYIMHHLNLPNKETQSQPTLVHFQ